MYADTKQIVNVTMGRAAVTRQRSLKLIIKETNIWKRFKRRLIDWRLWFNQYITFTCGGLFLTSSGEVVLVESFTDIATEMYVGVTAPGSLS